MAPDTCLYPWDEESTYIRSPPFFHNMVGTICETLIVFNNNYNNIIFNADTVVLAKMLSSGAKLTKYFTTILRLSYDNSKVTIDI